MFCQPIAIISILCVHAFRVGVNASNKFQLLLTTVAWNLNSSEGLRLGVGLPEDQAERLNVAAVVTAVESNDLALRRDKDLHPAGGTAAAPLPLLNLAIAVVHEADTEDVALAVLIADEDLNGADRLFRPDLVHLRVDGGAVH